MAALTTSGPAPELIARYERHLNTRRGLSPSTVRNYIADLAPFAEYAELQGIALDDDVSAIRAFLSRDGQEHVQQEYRSLVRDYVSWLLEGRRLHSGRRAGQRGHERSSVVRSLAAIRSFVRFLIADGLLPDAPLWAPGSTLMRRFTPRAARRLPDVLSTEEAGRLVEAPLDRQAAQHAGEDAGASGSRLRDQALLELLYGAGLRVSEAAGLDTDHLDFPGRQIRVWGKGSKARVVPLGRSAQNALRSYAEEGRRNLVPEDGNASTDGAGALFLNRRGGRLSPRSIHQIVRRYAMQAGLRDDVHPHTLRHSFATHLLDGGADLRVVQELLGHSTPTATQVYTHVSQTEARRVYMSAHPLARPKP